MSLEKAYLRLISGHSKGFFARFLRALLLFCSWFYQLAIHLRNYAYDLGLFRQHRISVPVISVGNIVLGGVGKTPATLHLAQKLSQTKKVAILSRGYRSRAEKRGQPTVLCRGEGALFGPEECGDEPYLLAKHLPDCLILVGRDRVAAAKKAVELGAECILLDDGMQHRRLARSLDIVVMDAQHPFGLGACVPRGMLREPLSSLRRAGVILLTHCEPALRDRLEEQLKLYSSAQVIATQFEVGGLEGQERTEKAPSLTGLKVGLFCGIANPSQFLSTLRAEGAITVAQLLMGDHQAPSASQFKIFADQARERGAHCLICTEKDLVKLNASFHTLSPLPIFWLRRRICIDPIEEKNLMSTLHSL